MKIDNYDPKQDLGASTRFLSGILDKAVSFTQQIDSQVNIIIGIGSAIFLFSASKIGTENSGEFTILCLFAAASVTLGLLAIHPPKFMRKRGQRESLMYNKKINSFSTATEYKNRLSDILGDLEKITEQYALEIYNMNKFYYRPKRKLYKWSRDSLFVGIILTLLIILIKNYL